MQITSSTGFISRARGSHPSLYTRVQEKNKRYKTKGTFFSPGTRMSLKQVHCPPAPALPTNTHKKKKNDKFFKKYSNRHGVRGRRKKQNAERCRLTFLPRTVSSVRHGAKLNAQGNRRAYNKAQRPKTVVVVVVVFSSRTCQGQATRN